MHIPIKSLAPAIGTTHLDPDIPAYLLHTVGFESVNSPQPVGIVLSKGDHVINKGATTHTFLSSDESGGYHCCADAGRTDFHTPINVNVEERHDDGLHTAIQNAAKRASRWSQHIGKTKEDLLKNLTVHSDGDVSRTLIPVSGNNPMTVALALNAKGPLGKYDQDHRHEVFDKGELKSIVDTTDAENIASNLEPHLKIKTALGKNNGLTIHVRNLDPKNTPGGTLSMRMRLHKHVMSDILGSNDGSDKTYRHNEHFSQANALADTGSTPSQQAARSPTPSSKPT